MARNIITTFLLGASLLASCGKPTASTSAETTPPVKPEPAIHTAPEEKGDEQKVRAAFETIYTAVQAGDKTHYNTFFTYRGSDENRSWKDFLDVSNPEEKLEADKNWASLTMLLGQAKGYTVKKYFTETESEGTWHLLVIAIDGGGAEEEATMAFLKVKDSYAIGDID